jgi:hypothetical protein
MPELRFQWPAGQATFQLSDQEALKVVVALRRLGLGLSFSPTQTHIMVTKETAKFVDAESIVKKLRRGS